MIRQDLLIRLILLDSFDLDYPLNIARVVFYVALSLEVKSNFEVLII